MTTLTANRRRPTRSSLLRRAILANAAVMALALALLLFTPVTVSAPIRAAEAVIVAAGIAALFAINVILLRRTLAPLEDLAAQMQAIDLRSRERPTLAAETSSAELEAFIDAFNAMIDRLAEERRAGARAALLAGERERSRVARALHDEAGQTLTAVALAVEREAEAAEDAQAERLAELAAQLHDTLDEIRRISRELRPEALDDLGLVNALIALTTRIGRQGQIVIERRIDPDLPPIPPDVELAIYRVAQEALTNVLRHAEATRCSLTLRATPGGIELQVADDGRGLDGKPSGETIGIEGMRERAMLAGGELTLSSPPGGRGTTVTLSIPLEEGNGAGPA